MHLRSYPDGEETREGDLPAEAPGTTVRVGGLASVRAVTRVKPEQASKDLMRAPSLLLRGEGRWGWSEEPTDDDRPARRGSGHSTYASNEELPRETCRGAHGSVQPALSAGPRQESEGPIRAAKPAKAGGAKGPWFGVCLDETRGGGLA